MIPPSVWDNWSVTLVSCFLFLSNPFYESFLIAV
jgi:hypothetical protein